ncbi:MAG: formylglycine-generating enzyme family protein [Candidatus Binatia bacterium]
MIASRRRLPCLVTVLLLPALVAAWVPSFQRIEKTWPRTLTNSIGMPFVLIPAGEFMMGLTGHDADTDEQPVHKVIISRRFYLGKYEVTQRQWTTVMGDNPSRFAGDANRPVEQASWEDVQEFIRRLNAREGGTKYRLPTEAEWEYAARAGSTTIYSFGNDQRWLGEYAWYADNSDGQTHPVGQLKPNNWGLYDLHGNVWEWVQDWYGDYSTGTITDPPGPVSGSAKVVRGGSWAYHARFCRSAYRYGLAPDYRFDSTGFRLLRTAPSGSLR